MKISEQYAGTYLKAADLPQPRAFTIANVQQTQMPEGETKPVMRFAGEQLALVLNKTNAFILAEMFGDETDAWNGKQAELYSTTTSFGGRMVPCIRVRAPQQPVQPQTAAPQAAPQQPTVPVPGQSVPSQTAPQYVQPQPTQPPPMEAPAASYPIDA